MGRIRSIKPEILEDDKTANLPHLEWRLFVSLWLLADDYGNLRGEATYVKGAVLWAARHAHDDVEKVLETLARVSLLSRYRVRGQVYIHINGWDRHQKVDKPGKPRMPGPSDENAEACDRFAGSSRESRESLAPDLDHDHEVEKEEESSRESRAISPPPPPPPPPPTSPTLPSSEIPEHRPPQIASPPALRDRRIKLNHEAWQYAALKHAELRGEGIDVNAIPWPVMPAGEPAKDLIARTGELLALSDPPDIRGAEDIMRRRVDVVVAESRREGHLRWFTPSLLWDAKKFYRAIEINPAEAAQRRGRTNGSPAPMRIKRADDAMPPLPPPMGAKP